MQALNNVSMIEQETVFGHIQSWLRNISKHSENTFLAYNRDIRQFFMTVKNKDIENLKAEDLNCSLSEVLNYQTLLQELDADYKNTSINRKIGTIKSLYSFLKAHNYDVNPFVFKEVKALKDDTKTIGTLSVEETIKIAEIAFNTEKKNSLNKKAMILFAGMTSIRKDAVRHLKFSHIRKNEERENMYIISSDELFDKGTMVHKDITGWLYDMMLESHGEKGDNDPIFDYSPSGLDLMLNRWLQIADIDPKRNISFHSFKKTGVQWVADNFGIHAAQMQAGHKSPETTSKSYVQKQRNLAVDMYNQIDESIFDQLSRDEMLVLLRSFGNGVGSQLRSKAQEIVDKRERF